MEFNWQTIAVAACIAWALTIVVRRGWRLVRAGPETGGQSTCSGCGGGCSPDVVRLEVPAAARKR